MALTDSLVEYWPLDEASGSRAGLHGGLTLTDNNTVGSATGLVYGTAGDFEASDGEYLTRADHASLSGADDDFTIAAWMKLESDVTGQLVGKGTGSGYEYLLEYNAPIQQFRFRAATGSGEAGSNTVIDGGGFGGGIELSVGTWYLVFAWHDAANNQIGVASSTNAFAEYVTGHTGGVWDSTGDFNIGRSGPYFPSYFDGLIGPVMFWRRLLSGAEKTELYNGGAGLTYAAFAGGGGGTKGKPFLPGGYRPRLHISRRAA